MDIDLKKGMNAWATANVSLTEFADAMGYRYQNAWGILRGKAPVTVEAVGRFALAYGPAALSEMLALAGLTDRHEVRFEKGTPVAVVVANPSHPPGGEPEPVYTHQPVEAA